MIEVCRSAAEEETGFPSAKPRHSWTADEDAQILAVGSRAGQVTIGDLTLGEVKVRWDNLHRKKTASVKKKTASVKKKTAPVKKKAAPVKKKVRKKASK